MGLLCLRRVREDPDECCDRKAVSLTMPWRCFVENRTVARIAPYPRVNSTVSLQGLLRPVPVISNFSRNFSSCILASCTSAERLMPRNSPLAPIAWTRIAKVDRVGSVAPLACKEPVHGLSQWCQFPAQVEVDKGAICLKPLGYQRMKLNVIAGVILGGDVLDIDQVDRLALEAVRPLRLFEP